MFDLMSHDVSMEVGAMKVMKSKGEVRSLILVALDFFMFDLMSRWRLVR